MNASINQWFGYKTDVEVNRRRKESVPKEFCCIFATSSLQSACGVRLNVPDEKGIPFESGADPQL
jgi:hypothetical protein